jgi:hypothetical protein
MSTLKQIEASRDNAVQSTGPKTTEGEAGATLNSFRQGLEAEWQPRTPTERFYVERMAVAQSRLWCIELRERDIYSQPAAPTQLRLLDRLWQAQRRQEDSFAWLQQELERLQDSRSRNARPC